MAQMEKGQVFREDIRMTDATEVKDIRLASLASGGGTLTINPDGSTATATVIGGIASFSGGRKQAVTVESGATPTALTAADSGKVFISSRTSTTQTWTLPSAATAGIRFLWVTTSAASEVLINPITGQTIQIKATVDQGASVVTAAGTGIKNTAATNVVGDCIELISDGVTGWVGIRQSGIWASQ